MKFLIAGDFYPNTQKAKQTIKEGHFDSIVGGILPFVQSADFALANFESPIADPQQQSPYIKKGPRNLASDRRAIECMKYAGFSMLALANNHFHDYGDEGVKRTMATCGEYGIPFCGSGNNLQEAQLVKYVACKGKTIGVVNFCENEFSVATRTSAGANPFDIIEIYHQIKQAREKADYVIVFIHGGIEHYQLPTPLMQKRYRFFIETGADMVINSHQHCYSGYEYYQGKPIVYGLGNLFFDNDTKKYSIWNEGYMVMITEDTGVYKVELIPYIQGLGDYTITVLNDRSTFDKHIKELNDIIQDTNRLQSEFDNYVQKNTRDLFAYFEPYSTRLALKLYRMGLLPSMLSKKKRVLILNRIRCESHQQVYAKALSLSLNMPF